MKKQDGFSLIELMVGMAIGMIVLTGAITIFATTFRANLDNVKQQRFEQSIQVLTSTMAANIRRAGYFDKSAPTPVALTKQANANYFHAQGDCITFSYEIAGVERFYGYKVENKIVYGYDQPQASGNANCTNLTNWLALTDKTSIEVTAPTGGNIFVASGGSGPTLISIRLLTKAIGLGSTGGAPSQRDTTTQVAVRN